LGDNNNVRKKEVIKGRFLDDPQDLDWVAMLGLIQLPLEAPESTPRGG